MQKKLIKNVGEGFYKIMLLKLEDLRLRLRM